MNSQQFLYFGPPSLALAYGHPSSGIWRGLSYTTNFVFLQFLELIITFMF
jgi:hypothetical protein